MSDDESNEVHQTSSVSHAYFSSTLDQSRIPRVLIFDVAEELATFKGPGKQQQQQQQQDTNYNINREKASIDWKGRVDVHFMNGSGDNSHAKVRGKES